MTPKIKYPIGFVGKDEVNARSTRFKMFGYSPAQGKTFLIHPKGMARVEGVRFKTVVIPKDLDISENVDLEHKISEIRALGKNVKFIEL